MSPFGASPFASLSLIAAPAVLTNASSVLALSTSNRFARAIDRARALSSLLERGPGPDAELTALHLRQLGRAEKRAILLLHALRLFYLSIGSFAAATLTSLMGVLVATDHVVIYRVIEVVAALAGVLGVSGLVFGTSVLVEETRLAVNNVSEEAALLRERYRGDRSSSG